MASPKSSVKPKFQSILSASWPAVVLFLGVGVIIFFTVRGLVGGGADTASSTADTGATSSITAGLALGPVNESASPDQADAPVLGAIEYAGESVPLLWTDDNAGENLIIKSDRRYYDAGPETVVFFSVTNESGREQAVAVYFWFDGADKRVKSTERINEGEKGLKLTINNEVTAIERNGKKDIKGHNQGSQIKDTIGVGATANYRAVVACDGVSKQSEFFIEAIGDQGAYGHLDPYLSSGLVGHWTFDGPDMDWASTTAEVIDRSGYGNNGNMVNMSMKSAVEGKLGQGLKFDGVDDYVNLGDPISLRDIAATAFTYSGWIKVNKDQLQTFLFSKSESSSTNG